MNAAEAAAASVALAGVTENLGAAAGKAGDAFKAGTRGTGGAEVKKLSVLLSQVQHQVQVQVY